MISTAALVNTLFALLVLCHFACATDAESCTLLIRASTVVNSRQSSCFKNHKFTSVQDSDVGKPNFFHTKGKEFHDRGFHWFVVKLKQTVKVNEIVIRNRESESNENEHHLSSRAAGIEMWTSEANPDAVFSQPDCSAGIGHEYEKHRANWKRCGSTPPVSSGVSRVRSGETLVVKCRSVQEARYILLRKNADDSTEERRKYMSFVDMWINTVSLGIEMESSGALARGSSLTVRCKSNCIPSPNNLHVCGANRRNCQTNLGLHIDSLQPSHAGTYTCQIGTQVVSSNTLTVQYPPEKLQILPSSAISCGGDSTSTADSAFAVASSAAVPTPEHNCSAVDGSGKIRVLMRQPERLESGEDGSMTSHWLCTSCGDAASLTVSCSSIQDSRISHSTEWKCEPPAEVSIEFGKLTERQQVMKLEFIFSSSAASPIPDHNCSAVATGAEQLSVRQWDNQLKRNTRGDVETHWGVSVKFPRQPVSQVAVNVSCTAGHSSAWARQVAEVWQRPKANSPSFAWPLGLFLGACVVLVGICVTVAGYYKLERLAAADPNRVAGAIALGLQAVQQLRADPSSDCAGFGPVVEENVYDLVQKLGNEASMYDQALTLE